MQRALLGACVGLILFASSGCIKESEGANGKVFSYETWVPLAIIAGGIAAVPIGLLIVKKFARYGWVFLILGPLAAVLIGPGMFRSHVTIGADRLTCRLNPFFFFSSEQTIEFSDLRAVRLTSEETRGRRGRKTTSYFLNFDRKGGESIKISATAELVEAAAEDLKWALAKHNISIQDQVQ